MDAFSFLSVLLSIILGLAITHVLSSTGRLVHNRANVRFYWPVGVWMGLLLLIYIQGWWSSFGLRGYSDWSFLTFLVVLLQSIGEYMLAAFLLPEYAWDKPVDMKSDYFRQAPWFFGTLLFTIATSVTKDVVLNGHLPDAGNLLFHVGFFALGVVGAITKREWFHKIVPVVSILAFAIYISLLFAKLK